MAEQDEHLPNHTVSMRKALDCCNRMKADALRKIIGGVSPPHQQSNDESSSLEWKDPSSLPITVDVIDEVDPSEFRTRFHRGNLPCLIRGLDRREFATVTAKWVITEDGSSINGDWFLDAVGSATMVPVRIETAGGIDQDGRAEECETLEMSMSQWIDSKPESSLYLKDWHLIKHLEDAKSINEPLYDVPEIFKHDILNNFLIRFTDGDYRFVYWGPAGSRTPIHSDVLSSFSWSYNVVGHKRWTFYLPDSDDQMVVEQHAGECIFVPSGWKHEVENVVETLSINHNWVTTANVDGMLACVLNEMKAVEEECREWDIDDLEARESMLRGCCGLDISCCFLLLLFSLLSSIVDSMHEAADIEVLRRSLEQIMNNENLECKNRLASILASEKLADEAVATAMQICSASL